LYTVLLSPIKLFFFSTKRDSKRKISILPLLMFPIFLIMTTKIKTRNQERRRTTGNAKLTTSCWIPCSAITTSWIMTTTLIKTRNQELRQTTGNAKLTSSCWILCSATTPRIRTKNKDPIKTTKVSF